jgi:hypothetical protein
MSDVSESSSNSDSDSKWQPCGGACHSCHYYMNDPQWKQNKGARGSMIHVCGKAEKKKHSFKDCPMIVWDEDKAVRCMFLKYFCSY